MEERAPAPGTRGPAGKQPGKKHDSPGSSLCRGWQTAVPSLAALPASFCPRSRACNSISRSRRSRAGWVASLGLWPRDPGVPRDCSCNRAPATAHPAARTSFSQGPAAWTEDDTEQGDASLQESSSLHVFPKSTVQSVLSKARTRCPLSRTPWQPGHRRRGP